MAVPIDLPPEVVHVRAGDVDGDGREELVLISRRPRGHEPDAVTLTVVHVSAEGRESGRTRIELDNEPLFWDLKGGLWALDGEGLLALDPEPGSARPARRRIASFATPLAGLGPTSPLRTPLAHDLDGDGNVELVAWSGARYRVFTAAGEPWGSLAAPARGDLSSFHRAGGRAVSVAAQVPPRVVGDVDGDGDDDLLLPRRDTVRVGLTGDRAGREVRDLALPLDLEPREIPDAPEEGHREIAHAWFRDVDGDGRLDLLVHWWVHGESWFGATAEIAWYRGSGHGFAQAGSWHSDDAVMEVMLEDVDGDGDLDLRLFLADLGLTALARALVAREARVDMVLLPLERLSSGASGFAEPVRLASLDYPVDRPEDAHYDTGDMDGDGVLDWITNEGEDRLRVYRGRPRALSSEPLAERELEIPPGDDSLLVRDLTGDGAAEILVWGKDRQRGSLVRYQP